MTRSAENNFPVTVTQLPVTRCQICQRTVAYRPGEASAADIDLYQRTANSLRRLLESVGLQRRARDVTPSLAVECARIVAERETKTSTGVVSDENHTEPACGGAA